MKRKVRKWVCMGGNFKGFPPVDNLEKVNPNFQVDPEAAHYAVNHWPVTLVFAGREVGSVPSGVRAGEVLAETPPGNPVRRAYELFFGGEVRDRHVESVLDNLLVQEPQFPKPGHNE